MEYTGQSLGYYIVHLLLRVLEKKISAEKTTISDASQR